MFLKGHLGELSIFLTVGTNAFCLLAGFQLKQHIYNICNFCAFFFFNAEGLGISVSEIFFKMEI